MNFSPSEENYIKHIYHLQLEDGTVSASQLASSLETTAASVTEMLKKLNTKKILHYQPYKNFSLTDKGNKVALEIVRKHRLWEFFLVAKLGFTWDEVHDVAEQLEHIQSIKL
ncbi:MAG: metal-dependent transcriptional regulator, partial [Ferruginibacter sp.]